MRELVAEFFVAGEAKTAGSKKGFVNPRTGGVVITDDTGLAGKAWRSDVKLAAIPCFPGPLSGPLAVEILFERARPRGHYGSGRNADQVRASAPIYPATRPDVDKLSRAVLDALKGVAWHDDAQVTTKLVRKRYADMHRTVVRIFREPQDAVVALSSDEQLALLDSGGLGCYHGRNGDEDRTEALAV